MTYCYGCQRPIADGEPSWEGREPGTLRKVALCADCMAGADHDDGPGAISEWDSAEAYLRDA
jgi:hypothetical protein